MREFEAIERYFAPLAEAGMIGDDAALLDHRIDTASTDAMVQGVHFRAEDPPEDLARKLLRVNLSDFAAMGARPRCYLLTLTLTRDVFHHDWLSAFAAGLAEDQKRYSVRLAGGDITRGDSLVLSLALLGDSKGAHPPLTRSGAVSGDDLCVSGWLGQAALHRRVLDGAIRPAKGAAATLERSHRRPQPRLSLARRLRGLARAAIDISDGLTGDLSHLCGDGLGARIQIGDLPLSPASLSCGRDEAVRAALGGGEDYELLFACPARRRDALDRIAREEKIPITVIGRFTDRGTLEIIDDAGRPVEFPSWSHF